MKEVDQPWSSQMSRTTGYLMEVVSHLIWGINVIL